MHPQFLAGHRPRGQALHTNPLAHDFVDLHGPRRADQARASGEHYFVHCDAVAESLVEWKMDLPTICAGLLHDVGIVSGTIVAFARLDWRFAGPVRIGDALSLEMSVLKTKAAGSQAGLVVFDSKVTNQKGEMVQKGEWSLLIKRKTT